MSISGRYDVETTVDNSRLLTGGADRVGILSFCRDMQAFQGLVIDKGRERYLQVIVSFWRVFDRILTAYLQVIDRTVDKVCK